MVRPFVSYCIILQPKLAQKANWIGHEIFALLEVTQRRLIGCPKTSVISYQSTLHNIPEDRRSHLHCGVFVIASMGSAC